MTQKIYIPIGMPACGKTTYWNNHFNKEQVLRVSRDDINTMLSGPVYTQSINQVIKNSETIILESAIEQGFSVYIDRINPTPKARKRFINKANSIKRRLYFVALFFEPDLRTALNRNSKREDKTLEQREKLEEFIPDIAKTMSKPTFDEGFDEIHIIDINGTTTEVEKLRELDQENELPISEESTSSD